MEPVAFSAPNPAQNRKPNRFVSAFSLLFLFSCLGGLGGYILCGRIPPIYESEALVRDSSGYIGEVLKSRIPGLDLTVHAHQNHDELIARPAVLKKCVATNDLTSLESFSDTLQHDKIVPILSSSLDCERIAPGDPDFRVTCRSSIPEDAQTVLTRLLETYQAHITDQQNQNIVSYKSKLQAIKRSAKNDLNELELGRGQDLSLIHI